ncbi:hypothetical protein [Paenibacillus illinoisensis]|uniref:hypothetical protein n=1 Tax=Paenibacillus illinoisensis TaxID=59845 RepID=UPI003018CA8F
MEHNEKKSILFNGQPAVSQKKIVFENIEDYKDAISQFKESMVALVNEKVMSEQTAAKIILETEYSFFQQIIAINYTTEG